MATISHREVGQIGQNYLRSLFAVGFQGMLILVCVAIYAVLIQGIATGGDPIGGNLGHRGLYGFALLHAVQNRDDSAASLARTKERGVICREDMGPTGRACGTGKRRRTSPRLTFTALWRKQRPFCKKEELLGGRDDAKTIAQQLAEGRAQAAREICPARPGKGQGGQG